MSTIDLNIPHELSQQEALTRIKGLLSKLQREQPETIKDVAEEWKDYAGVFSFNAKGFAISGTIHVEPSSVLLHGKLPAMLSLFKGQISTVIKQKAAEILAP